MTLLSDPVCSFWWVSAQLVVSGSTAGPGGQWEYLGDARGVELPLSGWCWHRAVWHSQSVSEQPSWLEVQTDTQLHPLNACMFAHSDLKLLWSKSGLNKQALLWGNLKLRRGWLLLRLAPGGLEEPLTVWTQTSDWGVQPKARVVIRRAASPQGPASSSSPQSSSGEEGHSLLTTAFQKAGTESSLCLPPVRPHMTHGHLICPLGTRSSCPQCRKDLLHWCASSRAGREPWYQHYLSTEQDSPEKLQQV